LAKNAYKYGFVLSYPKGAEEKTGYSYESWHYRYIGRENALNFWNSGEVLDTWLAEQ
jgi:D-alanyl-D-alanine carboxypeptidase